MKDSKVKKILYSLLEKCPFGRGKECKLEHFRGLDSEGKEAWVEDLSEQEIAWLVSEHERCFWERTNHEVK